jgi:hypothetical protein
MMNRKKRRVRLYSLNRRTSQGGWVAMETRFSLPNMAGVRARMAQVAGVYLSTVGHIKTCTTCAIVYQTPTIFGRLPSVTLQPWWLSCYSDGLRAGRLGFDSRQRQDIFLFSAVLRPALGTTQPSVQWLPGGSSPPSVKRLRREDDH